MNCIVIFAPHPDDEVIACTYVIKRALYEGKNVIVVFVTNGDFKGRKYADIRIRESERALEKMGVSEKNIFYFGYGDGMIYKTFCTEIDEVIPSRCSYYTYASNRRSTFHKKLFDNEIIYSKRSILNDFIKFFDVFKPETIYSPSCVDAHDDHKGTYFFIIEAIRIINNSREYYPNIYTYLVHVFKNFHFWPNRIGSTYRKPFGINMQDLDWKKRIIVTPKNTDNLKYELISFFKSQKPRSHIGFLYAFSKNEEIFWKVEMIDG